MPLILHLETATGICSVALSKDNQSVSVKETNEKNAHSSMITVFIEEVLKKANVNISDINAVAVSKGPGSYTGLRIGVSAAKGLCYAIDKPLIAISTLQAMAYEMAKKYNFPENNLLFCPMLDARRMEVYNALYDSCNNEIKPISAEIINKDSFKDILNNHRTVFFGDGALKCKQWLSHNKNAVFIDDIFPSAVNMITLAEERYKAKQFEDIAYFEPYYLKDFIAGKPNVKGLY